MKGKKEGQREGKIGTGEGWKVGNKSEGKKRIERREKEESHSGKDGRLKGRGI